MALVVGELTAYLKVDKSDWSRGLNEAKSDLDNLGRTADRQADATSARTSRMVNSVSDSMSKVGLNASQQGRDAGTKLVDGLDQGLQGAGAKAAARGQDAGGKFGAEFSKRIGEAFKALPDATVKVDDAGAQARIAALRQSLESLSDKKVGVDLSAEQAIAEVQRIRAELSSLSDETVNVQVKADTHSAMAELDRFFGSTGAPAQASGEDAGGKLSQGMNMAITRNSPLIVAAIGGALAAGAPVAIAGATALFAGIGIVAAAQSEVVQKAWSNTWDNIKAGAQADAGVLVPVLTNAASVIGESFQRMRPMLQDAFSASAPLIDTFVGSVTRAAENALPGMVRAVQAAGPVMTGLGSLMESIGTGISGFFDNLSAHAPAAGAAFAAIGDALGQLLPLLGDILGQGAELGATVLPMLANALGAVRSVVSALGPALPALVAAFVGLKAASAGMNTIESAAGWLGKFGSQAEVTAAGATRASAGMSALGVAIPVVGAALGVAINAWGEHDRQVQENVATFANLQQAMVTGGDAAITAGLAADKATWFWKALGVATEDIPGFKKAADDAHALFDAMSPLQQAQTEVTHWTNELAAAQGNASYVMRDMDGNAVSLTQAQGALTDAQSRAAGIQRELDQATSGMSRTLQQAADAADQLSSALDALNGGQLSLNDANRAYQQSLADINERLDGARQGLDGYSMSLDNTTESGRQNTAALDDFARAAEDSANAVYKQTGSYDQFSGALINGRNALYDSAVAFGMSDEAARAYVDSVLAIPPVTSMDIETNTQTVQQELQNIGQQLTTLPPGQALVTWASDEAVQRLAQMGYDIVGLPDGEVAITATDNATPIVAGVAGAVTTLGGQVANPTVGLNSLPFDSGHMSVEGSIVAMGALAALPTADLNHVPFDSGRMSVEGAIATLSGQTALPTADMNPGPFNGIAASVQASINNLTSQHPTPTADMNPSPFNGVAAAVQASIANVAAQRPTPVASLNGSPLFGTANTAFGILGNLAGQRPNPIATMTDYASGIARSITAAINSIPAYRTVTVAVQQVGAALSSLGRASGGPIGMVSAAAVGRKVIGPGGPTDDLVRAVGPGGSNWALSNGEWVIRAASSAKYGDRKMSAVNAGTAQIVLPTDRPRVRALASGGTVGSDGSWSPQTAGGNTYNVTLNSHGVDFSKQQDRRRIVREIRDGIVELERAAG